MENFESSYQQHICKRTSRMCEDGAFDGNDGWDIDCAGSTPETCEYAAKNEKNNTIIFNPEDVYNWIQENNLFNTPSAMKIATLLGGDRLSCIDEAVAIKDEENKKIVGVATIAPNGEENSGQPTIVGEFILPEYRGKGLGKELFIKTLERCRKRGFESVRVDIMSNKITKIVEDLQKDDKWSNYIKIGMKDTILDRFQG